MGVPSSTTPLPILTSQDDNRNTIYISGSNSTSSFSGSSGVSRDDVSFYYGTLLAADDVLASVAASRTASLPVKAISEVSSACGAVASGVVGVVEGALVIKYAIDGNQREATRSGLKAGVAIALSVAAVVASGPVAAFAILVVAVGSELAINGAADNGWFGPLVVDLDGDGIELVGLDESFILWGCTR